MDFERLFTLRLVIARYGEMDMARWWNTKGQLGPLGSMALRRGFPRTHSFAQARSVFAVAANRCSEVFNPPGCVTFWSLPETLEEEFDLRWEKWLDNPSPWIDTFRKLETMPVGDLISILKGFDLVDDSGMKAYSRLKISMAGNTILLPEVFSETDGDVTLLAMAFAKGTEGSLAIPYAKWK